MPRPTSKNEFLEAEKNQFEKLIQFTNTMSEKEMNTPFDFSADLKKTEAHWQRDKNLRDVLVHLYEWQRLLLVWLERNGHDREGSARLLPPPYNWKTYGDMNREFCRKHQETPLEKAWQLLNESHQAILETAEQYSEEELFAKSYFRWTSTTSLGAFFISVGPSHYDWALKKLKAHRKNCTQ